MWIIIILFFIIIQLENKKNSHIHKRYYLKVYVSK